MATPPTDAKTPHRGSRGGASCRYGPRSQACLCHPVLGLLEGEALEDELVDEAGARERAELEVVPGGLGGLLVPVGPQAVNGPRGVTGRDVLEDQLVEL